MRHLCKATECSDDFLNFEFFCVACFHFGQGFQKQLYAVSPHERGIWQELLDLCHACQSKYDNSHLLEPLDQIND